MRAGAFRRPRPLEDRLTAQRHLGHVDLRREEPRDARGAQEGLHQRADRRLRLPVERARAAKPRDRHRHGCVTDYTYDRLGRLTRGETSLVRSSQYSRMDQ